MESGYLYPELADMHLVVGEYNRNATGAVGRCREKYPNQRVPSDFTFLSISLQLLRYRNSAWNVVVGFPKLCTKCMDGSTDPQGCCYLPCFWILHITRSADVFLLRSVCARGSTAQCNCKMCILSVSQRWTRDPIFAGKFLFTDKSCFTRAGMASIHTKHVWSDENPHLIWSHHYQQWISVNLWLGILGDFFIGP